jgi:hypothetical protein
MIKIITVIISFILFPFTAQAQHEKEEPSLTMGTMLTALPIHCAPTPRMETVFKKEQVVFTGLVDQANVFKIYINKEGIWSGMLESVAGISCVFFSGAAAVLKTPQEEDHKKPTKANHLKSILVK